MFVKASKVVITVNDEPMILIWGANDQWYNSKKKNRQQIKHTKYEIKVQYILIKNKKLFKKNKSKV